MGVARVVQRAPEAETDGDEAVTATAMVADRPHRYLLKALLTVAAVAVGCAMLFQFGSTTRQLESARRDLSAARTANERVTAALKFFELQTSLGVADYGHAPSGIMPRDAAIRALARRLSTREASFGFVRDEVGYARATTLPNTSAGEVLEHRIGNCQGKANLLASLMLAQGFPADRLRVVYGHVRKDGMPTTHAWVEVLRADRWWVMDSTPFLDIGPGIYDRDQYYAQNSVVPVVSYTDKDVDFEVR